jgi:hypothetical protein
MLNFKNVSLTTFSWSAISNKSTSKKMTDNLKIGDIISLQENSNFVVED